LKDTPLVSRLDKRFDYPMRNWIGPVTTHDEPGYPNGTVDASPLMTTNIKDNE
jgi:hypothetical protein